MDSFDEAFAPDGEPRPLYAPLVAELERRDLARLEREARAAAASRGLAFGAGEPIDVDPVPRLLGAAEWAELEGGLLQRARALNEFLRDAYGEQRIFDAGVVPKKLLGTSRGYEPLMRGLLDDATPPATVIGFDLVRDPSGRFLVLEDNARMPSGAAYATGLRDAFEPLLDGGAPRPLGSHLEALGQALRGATGGEGGAAILSEGGDSGAWFEHRELSRRLAVPIVRPEQLRPDGDRLVARLDDRRPVLGALYRRLDEERLSRPDGSLTALGEMLVPALRAGTLRCLNAFGAGVADDKLAHAHVERMVEFYLGEEALLPSVPTFEVGGRGPGAVPPARLGELVVKPRDAFGGQGVTLMPLAGEEERERVLAEVRREPRRFVAQPIVPLSTHPTIRGGRLVRRHVDLRPFVVCAPAGPVAMPGGLTRFAPGADDMVVNSSRGGGCKDTWVIDR